MKRWRIDRGEDVLHDHARAAARFAADHLSALREADPELPDGLSDRARDNWRGLISIADLAGGKWPHRAREAAVGLTPAEDASRGVQLLTDIRTIFCKRGDPDWIPSAQIVDALVAMEDRPWAECGKAGKALTQLGLSNRLKGYKVKPKQSRNEVAEQLRGYSRAHFADLVII